jgi:hypothetical protein
MIGRHRISIFSGIVDINDVCVKEQNVGQQKSQDCHALPQPITRSIPPLTPPMTSAIDRNASHHLPLPCVFNTLYYLLHCSPFGNQAATRYSFFVRSACHPGQKLPGLRPRDHPGDQPSH